MVDLRITNTMYSSFLVFASIALTCLGILLPGWLDLNPAALSHSFVMLTPVSRLSLVASLPAPRSYNAARFAPLIMRSIANRYYIAQLSPRMDLRSAILRAQQWIRALQLR